MPPEDSSATPHDVNFGAVAKHDHLLVHVPIGDVESLSISSDSITVVELNMMDKRMYFPLTALSGLTIRSILYPFTLVKTRLQLQRQRSVYTSLFDAFKKIVTNEGPRGLYRGFWISNLMIFSQMSYIGTYEFVRTYLAQHTQLTDRRLRSLIAGGCASVIGQTMIVPIDIVSQHLQLLGLGVQQSKKGRVSQNIVIPSLASKSRFYAAQAIIAALYQQEGVRGFYKGYAASLMTYAPGSAMWWLFYDVYCGMLSGVSPIWVPRLCLQCIAAPLGGASATVLTTPLDAIRARIQVENTRFIETARSLWHEEHIGIFFKGLSARLIQSLTFSFFIILGYESIKRWSLLDEFKDSVRW